MASVIQNNFRVRKNYAKITKIIDIPNLIDIQKQSYEKFLQKDIPIDKREDVGLQGVFKSVFPIKDFSETSSLEFVSYTLDKPKYDVDECRQRGMTFAAPIKVIVRLVVWDTNEETGSQSIRDVKEQEVFFGEIPLMTDNGTFIISCTAARACSTITTRARRTRRASCCTAPASSPTAARGWTSSSTPRICSTCASTAAASCTRPCCCAPSVTPPKSCST